MHHHTTFDILQHTYKSLNLAEYDITWKKKRKIVQIKLIRHIFNYITLVVDLLLLQIYQILLPLQYHP